MGSPAIIRLCCYIVYFIITIICVQQPGGQGDCNPPVKDRDTLIEQSVTRINEVHRIIVYDEFMKQIRTVKHRSNTTGRENYRVQLAVPSSIKNNYDNTVLKEKLTNKY